MIQGEAMRMSLQPEHPSTQTFPIRGTTVYFESSELTETEETDKNWNPSIQATEGAGLTVPLPPNMKTPPDGRPVAVSVKSAPPAETVHVFTGSFDRKDGVANLQPASDSQGVKLDATTIRFHGNVIVATQVETVTDEILGSGDASQAHQNFSLKRWPLAFVDPKRTGLERWTLSVMVDGVEWKRVRAFDDRLPDERIYVVALDDAGRATITFGDGIQGARLPSGLENVRATYGVSDPSKPPVAGGGQVNLLDRPLGIRAVTNLTTSVAPHKPETNDEIIDRAARFRRSWDRPVSLRDYQDFATAQGGIGKALAVHIPTSDWLGTHITVAPRYSSKPVPEASLRALAEHIRASEVYPALLAVENCRDGRFVLRARVELAAKSDWNKTVASIKSALLQKFGFAARALNQPLSQSELLRAITDIGGIRGVAITRFQRQDVSPETKSADQLIPAAPYWEPGSSRAAEIVYCADAESIVIDPWEPERGK
jgi:predicted phage baseplate assembly protein